MTVLEAKYVFGTRQTTISVGETLVSLARRLYNSDDSSYLKVLRVLNLRFDWSSLRVGDSVEYLSKEVVNKIQEV